LYPGISKILVAKGDAYGDPYGDVIAYTVKEIVQKYGYDKVIGPGSTFGKDVVPRIGGLLDV